MFRIRRATHDPRIELAPLIDVMLFLLTFFIYSVMMMERVDLVPMTLKTYQSGAAAKPVPAATISVDLDGRLYLDRAPIALDELASRLEEIRTGAPDLVVYLALADGSAEVDRSALLLDVWDRLQPGKFNVNIVGRQKRGPVIRDAEAPVSTPPAVGPTAPGTPSGTSTGTPSGTSSGAPSRAPTSSSESTGGVAPS
jgi:biopolymer transport protein ExbD